MKTATDYYKETALEFAQAAKSAGYDAYLAERGAYGFYTNGKRVVSFQCDFGCIKVSSNIKPSQQHGTGWIICDLARSDASSLERYITMHVPDWVRNPNPQYTTPEQHLACYGASSKYTKI